MTIGRESPRAPLMTHYEAFLPGSLGCKHITWRFNGLRVSPRDPHRSCDCNTTEIGPYCCSIFFILKWMRVNIHTHKEHCAPAAADKSWINPRPCDSMSASRAPGCGGDVLTLCWIRGMLRRARARSCDLHRSQGFDEVNLTGEKINNEHFEADEWLEEY